MPEAGAIRETVAESSNTLAWRELWESVQPHYLRAAMASIDAAVAAYRRLQVHTAGDLAMDADTKTLLVCQTRGDVFGDYVARAEGEDA